MIYVSQGHQESIGLEVFLKSFLLLTKSEQEHFHLVTFKDTLKRNLSFLNLDFELNESSLKLSNKKLSITLLKDNNSPTQTSQALTYCLEKIQQDDVLFTLPSSKDQFVYCNKKLSGHTEFFRSYYHQSKLTMVFNYKKIFLALITDHIPLQQVPLKINADLIQEKTQTCLNNLPTIKKVVIAGINPHAGENGLLGIEDESISIAIKNLKKNYPSISFEGPVSGDTFFLNPQDNTLYVSMFHDQGLTAFKMKYQFYGSHITLGLPFKRFSVDHGTAFNLYGKNSADYMGCYFVLKDILRNY